MADNELAKYQEQFPVLSDSVENDLEIINENVSGDTVNVMSFPRVKVPTGGGMQFVIPSAMGEDKTMAKIRGIIIHKQDCRAYWPGDYAGGEPPMCKSEDGIRGVGEPGGLCSQCPLSKFGPSGEPPECREMRRHAIMMEGSILPHIFIAPPTSLQAARKYCLGLAALRIRYWTIITEISLEKATSKDGITYAQAVFRGVEGSEITGDALDNLARFREGIVPMLESIEVGVEDGDAIQ